MRKFRALLALNFRAMLTTFRVKGRKGGRGGSGALILLAVLSAYLSGIYSFLFADQLAPAGLLSLLIVLKALMAVGLGFCFSLFAAQGIVFGAKDNDLMLSLPVSAFTLMLSRTLALYLENLVTTIFVFIPAGIAYLVKGSPRSAAFLLSLMVGAIFLALLPTLLSLIVGFLLAWVSSKFTRKALLSNVLYLAFFLLLFAGMSQINRVVSHLAQSAGGIEQAMRGWGLPFFLLEQAVCEGSVPALLGFCALCLGPFLLLVWLFGRRYKHIVTGLGARGARSDYRLGRLSAAGARRALLKKEAGRYFGTPIYLFNTCVGLLMLLIGGVVALVKRDSLSLFLAQLGGSSAALPILCFVLCFVLSTVAITASSISLEGKQLWILKSAPVSAGSLLGIKAAFQLLVTLPCLLAGTVLFGLACSLSPLEGLLFFATGAVFALFTAPFGLYVNLRLPKLDASSEASVVKQSASALISLFVPMLLSLAGLLLWLPLRLVLGGTPALLPCLALYAVCAAVSIRLLAVRGPNLFAQL